MAAAFIFFVFLQALLYAACYGEPCVGEWSTRTTKYKVLNFKEDSYVYVSCRYRHFKVDGEETIKCVGGQLPTYLPQCRLPKASCTHLKAPVLGSMKCSPTAPEVGSSCTFECQSTHYMRGTAKRICTEDLRWTGSEARCIMKSECSVPPPLHQGTVTGCSPERKPKFDDTCHFRCNDGLRLVGPSQLKCRLDGRLTDDRGRQRFPTCEPFEPGNPIVDATPGHQDVQSRPRPISPTSLLSCFVQNGHCNHLCHQEPEGIRCSCREGYHLSGDGRTCQVQTVWANPDPNVGATPTPEPIAPPPWLNCRVHSGYCAHFCHQEAGSIRCSCKDGYRLSQDGRTCEDVDECQNDRLNRCDHVCRNTAGSYTCLCRQGYTSPDGFKCKEILPSVIDFHNTPSPTSWLSCQEHNGYCSHHCHQEARSIRCSCRSGYRLASDGRNCVDVDECQNDRLHKCDHVCRNTAGSYACLCRQGYTSPDGFRCEETFPGVVVPPDDEDFRNPKSRFSCQEHNGYCSHHCHQEAQGIRCSCRSGYRLAPDGRSCIDVDECQNDRLHKCDHVCRNTAGSYKCLCRQGYTSPDGFRCEDVDECSDDGLNKCDHNCKNTDGGYICSCRAGFISSDGFRCEGCRVNSYRSTSDVSCKECPANSHTDGGEKTSMNDCVCNPGFTGNPGQGIPCEDTDECADGKNFGCSHICINTPGSAHCACPLGYQLKEDGKICTDIDECSIKNGGCDGTCHNTVGNFTCSCAQGYVSSREDKYSCDDLDECAEGNGGCSGECVNFKGGFHCFCAEGQHLHPDGKSCIHVHCPRVIVPHHSSLRCKNSSTSDKKTYKPGEMPQDVAFPVGATCRIKCDKGYDFRDAHPGIFCENNGKWNGSLPECLVLQCPPLSPPPHGDVYPPSCKSGSSTVKQKCFFTCEPGYRITGQEMLTCRNNLTWAKKNPTQCVPETEASISCPDDDITVELRPDEGWAEMRLNSPRTTLAAGPIRVSPEWVHLDRESIFPAGETEVTFKVATGGNETAECSISVIVLDTHPPVFPDCPDTLSVTSGLAGTAVSWEEPVPQDNVGVASVSKSLEPNSTLSPGLHFVEYVARDFAGNVGQCIFHVNVTATGGCQDLSDPEHGEANCHEWMFGKICQPTCFDNYTRPPEFYACDESGTWTPSDFISPCLPE